MSPSFFNLTNRGAQAELERQRAQAEGDMGGPESEFWDTSPSVLADDDDSLDRWLTRKKTTVADEAGDFAAAEVADTVIQAEAEDGPEADAAPVLPSFVREAERAARWQRPWVRAVLGLAAVGLLLALALQYVWFKRDYLAAQRPALRPALAQMCAVLGCELAPWQAVQALRVEAAGFHKLTEQRYRLTVHLSNRETAPVATPHVLLMLRNVDGQDVIKRHFAPADLGLPSSTLAPEQEYRGAALLELQGGAEWAKAVQDYEVELLYPQEGA